MASMAISANPTTTDSTWWLFLLTSTTLSTPILILAVVLGAALTHLITRGGPAWADNRSNRGSVPIPGPRGLPIIGSLLTLTSTTPHRVLAHLACVMNAKPLMAFSIARTPAVVASDPATAKEILSHPSFADRPVKRSARELMFARAIGFAPNGEYWRMLRRVAATHLFAPRRVAAHAPSRMSDSDAMLASIAQEQQRSGFVRLRQHLQLAALNNIMGSVFGRKYEEAAVELVELRGLVREGFELLGAFNWSDHLGWLGSFYDPENVTSRCTALVPRVRGFVKGIIEEHKRKQDQSDGLPDNADFVDVLLSLQGDSKLDEDDMVAVLWEMIFRGTDTTALLTEWAMAELILNPTVQSKLRAELNTINGEITDADVAKLPYLQAVVKESLRVHPPGPLLSWARLSSSDVQLSNGMVVPAHTTAMVNMWSITHDPSVWAEPDMFKPERFVVSEGGEDVDVRGGDLRLAPFGAGRRVCPGKNLGLVTVGMWVARLVKGFEWAEVRAEPVDLTEMLKLSCEMKTPLAAVAVPLVK